MNIAIDHYIQKDILRSLSHAEGLRFSELKPAGLENNIFMYHLKQLIAFGLVLKTNGGYSLSSDGLRYVDRVTRTNLDLRPQPKLISLFVISNEADEYVMYPRHAQPFMGRLALPSGRLHFGESLEEHISRELREKIGPEPPLQYKGSASVRLLQNGEVVTHVYAHLLSGKIIGHLALHSSDSRFFPQWVNVHKAPIESLMPGTLRIIEHTKQAFVSFLDLNLSR